MASEFQIQGLDGVLEKMRALGPALSAKGARTAMRKAANVVRDAAKVNAAKLDDPSTPNRIADHIGVQFAAKSLKTTGDIMMRVGVRGGAKQYADNRDNRRSGRVGKKFETGGSVFYWRFLEFGTSKMAARPFLRPALSENIDKATEVAVAELNKAIDRLAQKAGG
jgi:HK97 gp10 family phage protein